MCRTIALPALSRCLCILLSGCILFSACSEPSTSSVLAFVDSGRPLPTDDMNPVEPAPIDAGSTRAVDAERHADDAVPQNVDMGPTGPLPVCTEFLGQEECKVWSHCTYIWPGCTQDGVRSLPLAFAGCVAAESLCQDTDCVGGLTCQDVMIDPCPGEVCQLCGESSRVCLPPVSDTRCGGPDNMLCPAGQYCEYSEAAACGNADFGRCATIPPPCDQPCRHVCGCDGQTYCNACTAAHRGMSIRTSGFCPPPTGMVPDDCIQMTHPDVRILARGDACNDIELRCPEGQRPYQDRCSCGCLLESGTRFECENDADCVPEDCCRPTGCVARTDPSCAHDEDALCCFCGDCRAGVESCLCEDGLCRTQWDESTCE